MDNDSVSDGRRYRRKSDGNVYRIVAQARPPDGSVILRAVEGPGEIGTTNDRLAVDYEFFRVGEPERVPLVIPPDQQAFFDTHETAMNLAARAEQAHNAGDFNRAATLYDRAAEHEQRALDAVPLDKKRTRALTAESVAVLKQRAAALPLVTPVTEATYRARLDEAAALPEGWDADGEAPPPTAHEIAMARDLWPSLVAMGLDRCLDAEDVEADAMGGVSLTFRSPTDYRCGAWLTLRENRGTRQALITGHAMAESSKPHGGAVDELLRIAAQWVGAKGAQ